MGEIYDGTHVYVECRECGKLVVSWLITLGSYDVPGNEVDFMNALNSLVQHQIECHEKPELKILAEEKFILAV